LHDDRSYGVHVPGAGTYLLIAGADGYRPQASMLVVAGEARSRTTCR
jgi:hypothetical protein